MIIMLFGIAFLCIWYRALNPKPQKKKSKRKKEANSEAADLLPTVKFWAKIILNVIGVLVLLRVLGFLLFFI